jgi:hypothetical protein
VDPLASPLVDGYAWLRRAELVDCVAPSLFAAVRPFVRPLVPTRATPGGLRDVNLMHY